MTALGGRGIRPEQVLIKITGERGGRAVAVEPQPAVFMMMIGFLFVLTIWLSLAGTPNSFAISASL
jgi:hypothetical protein